MSETNKQTNNNLIIKRNTYYVLNFSQKTVAADPVDGTTIVNSFAVLLLGNTCTTGSMLPPVATITLHGLLPRTHDVCASYAVIHIIIVIVIVIVIELYRDGWSYDINGSFIFFILHIPNYRTICLYVVDWSTH